MYKVDDIVTREVLEADGFTYWVGFGNCLVFKNKQGLKIFLDRNTNRIRFITTIIE